MIEILLLKIFTRNVKQSLGKTWQIGKKEERRGNYSASLNFSSEAANYHSLSISFFIRMLFNIDMQPIMFKLIPRILWECSYFQKFFQINELHYFFIRSCSVLLRHTKRGTKNHPEQNVFSTKPLAFLMSFYLQGAFFIFTLKIQNQKQHYYFKWTLSL